MFYICCYKYVKIMEDKTYNPFFSAWRKGDLVKIYGKQVRLTSEAYEKMGIGIVCDTDEGDSTYIPYIRLIDDAKLIETFSGRKNLPCK